MLRRTVKIEVFTVNLDGQKSRRTAITNFPQKKRQNIASIPQNLLVKMQEMEFQGVSDLKISRGSMSPDPPGKLAPYGTRGAAGVDGKKN